MEGVGEEGVDMIEDSKDMQQQSKAFDKLTDHIEDHQLDSIRVQELNSSKLNDGPSNGSWSRSVSLGFVNTPPIRCGGSGSFRLASGNDVIFIDWVWISYCCICINSCNNTRPAIVFVLKAATAFIWKRRFLLHSSPEGCYCTCPMTVMAATAFVPRRLLLHSSPDGCYCIRPPTAATAFIPRRLLLHSSPNGCYYFRPPTAATAFIQKMMAATASQRLLLHSSKK